MIVTINGDTIPIDRCECGKPGEWRASYSEYEAYRDPPYRFFDRVYCEEHLPEDARAEIPEWASKSTKDGD